MLIPRKQLRRKSKMRSKLLVAGLLGVWLSIGATQILEAAKSDQPIDLEDSSLNGLDFFNRVRPRVYSSLDAAKLVEGVVKSLTPIDYSIKAKADAVFMRLEDQFGAEWDKSLETLKLSKDVLEELKAMELGEFEALTPRLAIQELLYRPIGALLFQKGQEVKVFASVIPDAELLLQEINPIFEAELIDNVFKLAQHLSNDDYTTLRDLRDALSVFIRCKQNLKNKLRIFDHSFENFTKIFYSRAEQATRNSYDLRTQLLQLCKVDLALNPQSNALYLKLQNIMEDMMELSEISEGLGVRLSSFKTKSQSLLEFFPKEKDGTNQSIWPFMKLKRTPLAQLLIMGQSLYLADHAGDQIRLRYLKVLIDPKLSLETLLASLEAGFCIKDFSIKSLGRFDLVGLQYGADLRERPFLTLPMGSYSYNPSYFETQQKLRPVSDEAEILKVRQDFERFLNEAFKDQLGPDPEVH